MGDVSGDEERGRGILTRRVASGSCIVDGGEGVLRDIAKHGKGVR